VERKEKSVENESGVPGESTSCNPRRRKNDPENKTVEGKQKSAENESGRFGSCDKNEPSPERTWALSSHADDKIPTQESCSDPAKSIEEEHIVHTRLKTNCFIVIQQIYI
jgi:hypothetical protein